MTVSSGIQIWKCGCALSVSVFRRLRRMTKQSRMSSEAHKARERETDTYTLARHYYVHYKGLQLFKVMWVIGTEVSRGEKGFSSYPERLVGFILNSKSTHPHIDALADTAVQDSVSIQEQNVSVSNTKKKQSRECFKIFRCRMCCWKRKCEDKRQNIGVVNVT